jgi:uncharacterized repeat protein (TIGR01451 family)
MKGIYVKNIGAVVAIALIFTNIMIILPSEQTKAEAYDGEELALAMLTNSSWLVDTSYSDDDPYGHDQAIVLSSLGSMAPTNGDTFALFSTGTAGTSIVSTNGEEPGEERGDWFAGGKYGYPRDTVTFTMTLQVPPLMHYIFYDIQFFSAEYPEYVGTQYNDKLTITIDSPSEGESDYMFDVNSGYFVFESDDIVGSGFDIYARSGNPGNVDYVDTVYREDAQDAGASDLVRIVGTAHPVSPYELITFEIELKDVGDNQFDSGAFIDNIRFAGEARTDIISSKSAYKQVGSDWERITGPMECGERVKYKVTITNLGYADQDDIDGENEFEDILPENVTYVSGSATSQYGSIYYDSNEHKIVWNGDVPAVTSRLLEFEVDINEGLENGAIISNQGTVFWDSNEDGTMDSIELTDNTHIDDGIDQDMDGDTDDDDPTEFIIVAFEKPDIVTENFTTDTPGESAYESYLGREWFETSDGILGSKFEVASSMQYNNDQSYKSKLRSSGSPQFWNYSIENLEGDISYWESWFACGDACEAYNYTLEFKNSNDLDIAKLKFEYIESADSIPNNWYLCLYYWDPITEWNKLSTDLSNGYLRNDWYKIKIESGPESTINYYLYRDEAGLVDSASGTTIGPLFEDLNRVEFSTLKEPIICPMFFWDEHTIGII